MSIISSALDRAASVVYRLNNRIIFRHTKQAQRVGRLKIGQHTYGLPILEEYAGSLAKVTIGKYCSIEPGVRIVTGGNHPTNWVSNYPFRIKMLGDCSYKGGMHRKLRSSQV